ncbi:hypothetical protein, partial [Streptosporangium sp. NPDC006007]|uniref:hypothetical protein n=1 Tax=Streptosporangium sp. NPDC006007 TaxID=3154575 RepID=UPI0033B4C239
VSGGEALDARGDTELVGGDLGQRGDRGDQQFAVSGNCQIKRSATRLEPYRENVMVKNCAP